MNFVMASDRQTDGDVLAMNGASAALCISPLPFQGPLGAVRLGLIDGRLVPFPRHDDLEVSELDLIVSGTRDSILMIEGFAREMPEDRMAEALEEAHKYVRELCELQQELIDKCRVQKAEFVPPPNDGLHDRLRGSFYDRLNRLKESRPVPMRSVN
jgi:polyribonucleotide nucleotidyltransferase